jgi:tripartite-type tricarboxylate transporter receptor subunit TctC
MKQVVTILFIGICFITPSNSWAKYPEKEINLIVPSKAGGMTDSIARLFITSVLKTTGVRININNVPGGEGAVALRKFQAVKPDGYTLFMNANYIESSDTFNITNFKVIAMLAYQPFATYVPKNSKIKSLSDIKIQKTNNNKFVGDTLFGKTAGLKLAKHLEEDFSLKTTDSKENTLALLKAQDIDFWIGPFIPNLTKSAEIVPIAVFSDRSFKDIPTALSQGINILESLKYAVIAPRGTSVDIINVLDKITQKAIKNLVKIKKDKDIGVEFEYRDADYYIKAMMLSYNDFCSLCECMRSRDCKVTCEKCNDK